MFTNAPPLLPILSHVKLAHNLKTYFFYIQFNNGLSIPIQAYVFQVPRLGVCLSFCPNFSHLISILTPWPFHLPDTLRQGDSMTFLFILGMIGVSHVIINF